MVHPLIRYCYDIIRTGSLGPRRIIPTTNILKKTTKTLQLQAEEKDLVLKTIQLANKSNRIFFNCESSVSLQNGW
jgi:hypothetical protein